jgi:hypothetical protein
MTAISMVGSRSPATASTALRRGPADGAVSITGNAQTTILNGGAFNNGLVINGAGVNDITNQAGAFINQTFSVTGSQNRIDNFGTLNND